MRSEEKGPVVVVLGIASLWLLVCMIPCLLGACTAPQAAAPEEVGGGTNGLLLDCPPGGGG